MRAAFSQAGRSLLELMIALSISLVLLGAALLAVIGTGATTRHQDAVSRLADDGGLVLALLSHQLRQAGYSIPRVNALPGYPASHYTGIGLRGCDGGFIDTRVADVDALACAGAGGSSAVSVLYEADARSTWPGSAGVATDCLGAAVETRSSAIAGDYRLVENRWFVAANPQTGNPTLYCAGGGGTGSARFAAQPLVDNVESLRLRWGVADGGTDAGGFRPAGSPTVTRWLTQAALDAEFAADPRRWTRVSAVQVCALLRTEPGVADAPGPYADCDGAPVTPADAAQRRVRRAFTATVQLRNRGAP